MASIELYKFDPMVHVYTGSSESTKSDSTNNGSGPFSSDVEFPNIPLISMPATWLVI